MKRLLLLLWLLVPLPVLVWHFGPGQTWLSRDRAHSLIQQAQQAEANQQWTEAERLYQAAGSLVGNQDPKVRIQMDMALVRARYRQGGAVEAIDGVDRILADAKFQDLPAPLRQEARELAGRLHYYAAWVMRLEGAKRELWLEEAELARQNFRMLTETSIAKGSGEHAKLQQSNLENAIGLQRMSMTELMARPLPEEGNPMAGQGLSEQMNKRRGKRGEGQQPGIGESDEGPPANGAGTTLFPGGPGS